MSSPPLAAAVRSGPARDWVRDALAGAVAAVVLVANVVSFGALMFPGPLAAGAGVAIWAMLVGAGVAGAWVAWKTTLPPLTSSIDSPAGAVMVLLATATGSAVLQAGGSTAAAVQAAMLMLSAATLAAGLLPLLLGLARLGAFLRFVPFPVVAGFLGATGWLLIAGGTRMAAGRGPGSGLEGWTPEQLLRVAAAVAVLAVLLAVRRWWRWSLALPATLLTMIVVGSGLLHGLGLAGAAQGWYLPSIGSLPAWHPFEALAAAPLSPALALRMVPEVIAVALVGLVSVVTKTATLEVARRTPADLDAELRAHGIGNLIAAPLGGLAAHLQLGSSRLLDHAGSASWRSGLCASGVLLLVALTHFDLPGLIPLPVAAGLVFSLGWSFLVEAFARPIAQRAWGSVLFGVAIAFACVRFGYIVGVIGGVMGACVLFALGYARIGPVRRQLTRAQYAGQVMRAAETARRLQAEGEAIRMYWLSGHLFFGSSETIFERVREDLEARPAGRVAQVILDFGAVTGADASAGSSLAKLAHLCRRRGSQLLFAALPPAVARLLRRDGVLDAAGPPGPFDDLDAALAWSEDQLLARDAPAQRPPLDAWLREQLGEAVDVGALLAYFVPRTLAAGAVLYRAGEPADQIDIVTAGRLAIELPRGDGPPLRVRRLTTHAVIGEMGFVRRLARSATVVCEEAVELRTLSREAYERLRTERPELALALMEFLLRALADRSEMSDRSLLAVGR